MKLASFCKRRSANPRPPRRKVQKDQAIFRKPGPLAVGRRPHSALRTICAFSVADACAAARPDRLRVRRRIRCAANIVKGSFFSCPALALSVTLWPIQPVAESLQLETEDPFAADASRRPYAKTPRTLAFGMADLEVPLKGVQAGGGCLSLLHILY